MKNTLLCLLLCLFTMAAAGQSIYEVPVEQPPKFVLVTAGEDMVYTGTPLTLGYGVQTSGGSGTRTYRWVGYQMNDTAYNRFYTTSNTGIYELSVSDENNCSAIDKIEITTLSGISDGINTGKVIFYPNPVSDYLVIDPGNNDELKKIKLTGTDGRLIKEIPFKGTEPGITIDTDGIEKGTYILQLFFENQSIAQTVIFN
ncbi:MAG: T9SS type A sorting domain-containing protein [Bacteroidales bacterium]|nr:T9SS type A sorting domain-containing protein [Bacteroidales bacterium]